MSRIRALGWPRALTGHAVTAPPRSDMNSRRLIRFALRLSSIRCPVIL
jgi:hypothetical protein